MELAAIGLFLLSSTVGYRILAGWPAGPLNPTESHNSKFGAVAAGFSKFLTFPLPKPVQATAQQPDQQPQDGACDQPYLAVAPPPQAPVDAHALIRAAAQRHNVPVAFVKSIVAAESNFDCDAVSPKGAIGPMQLMPETAQEFGIDPMDPAQNIDAGTHYLRILLDRYQRYQNGLKRTIAAYNAGPNVVDRYHGVPPFKETRDYVHRVLAYLRQFRHGRG